MHSFVFDTTVIIKGLVKPRRKAKDENLGRMMKLHGKAREYLEMAERKEINMIIPSVALIETASVVSRLTNDESLSKEAVNFLWGNSKIFFDFEMLGSAIETGIRTKVSGFDALFLALLKLSDSTLLTDDSKLHNAAIKNGFSSKLLREMV